MLLTVKSNIIISENNYVYTFEIESDYYYSWEKIHSRLVSYLYDKGVMFDEIYINQYSRFDKTIHIVAFAE